MRTICKVIDTETTGIVEPDVVEYGEMIIPDFSAFGPAIPDVFAKRYRPAKEISPAASAAHGLLMKDLEGEDPSSTFVFDAPEYLIGHNIDFDHGVVGKPEGLKLICTLAIARNTWPTIDSHKLLALIYMLAPEKAQSWHKEAHGVTADIEMTFFLASHLIEHHKITSFEALYQLSENSRIPTHMPLGKFRGQPIKDVPRDYAQWYRRQDWADPYVLKAFDRARL